MTLNVARIRQSLQNFEFKALFTQELGWDKHVAKIPVAVDGKTLSLTGIAEKRGMQVFECAAPSTDGFPDYDMRRKIERQIAKLAHEHIIIYTDAGKTVQKWQWVRREPGRPLACREPGFQKGQSGEALVQKLQLLAVDLAEEESLALVHVTRKAKQAFDVDRVTKRFYDRFKTEHANFLKFIKGITETGDREWYASLMLNRLMFVYFIQKKGFLDGDLNYRRNRMQTVQEKKGKDRFHTFYRYFLLRLFHEGLGQPKLLRKKELEDLLGEVPYLNGGLFDVHDLETANPDIQIADDAFKKLFDFFDAYQWHLDERPLRADNEINPDVLGYIFEKYINQKQMGAYYTKEDITGYIARNTVIPFLFNAAEKKCAIAFKPESAVWRLLRDDPDRYIYPAVRHGVDMPLPPGVRAGIDDISKRGGWNGPTTIEYGLPTETWRESVARRQRCEELRVKLKAGEIQSINDLITYNLDICQFAEDVIENCEGPELLRAFYRSIAGHIPDKSNEKHEAGVSVLDPACGSGAFLFAALNILEPLYEACLDRMEAFLQDVDRSTGFQPVSSSPGQAATGKMPVLRKFSDFRKILDEVARHPNRRHFILKSIIINNLYGVDIMEEAVEICKLRLFLKLVAQVDKVKHLEPLPDIDFNIRPGNSLVGFASLEEVKKTLEGGLGFGHEVVDRIMEDAEIVDRAFEKFREMQTVHGMDAKKFSQAKAELHERLGKMRTELDRYLADQYGVNPEKAKEFQKWEDSHQPFHWFTEFYGIISHGGFDVLIGNPPYVEYSKVRSLYEIRHYETTACGNIYVYFIERSTRLLQQAGFCSLIVPLSLLCTDRMGLARKKLLDYQLWVPAFDIRPASLFEGVAQRLCIFISSHHPERSPTVQMGGYRRWTTDERAALIPVTHFTSMMPNCDRLLPLSKASVSREESILHKISGPRLSDAVDEKSNPIYIHRICRYFIKALDFIPHFIGADRKKGKSEDYKAFRFRECDKGTILCLINSSLFYWFWRLHGDGFHCGYGDVYLMPFKATMNKNLADQLLALHPRLMKSLNDNSAKKRISTKKGTIEYQEFYPKDSKSVMDEIDHVLAKHYDFTDEELDFIINYDIKYRMGQDGGEEADE